MILPTEMTQHVLHYLEPRDLSRAALSCTHMQSLSLYLRQKLPHVIYHDTVMLHEQFIHDMIKRPSNDMEFLVNRLTPIFRECLDSMSWVLCVYSTFIVARDLNDNLLNVRGVMYRKMIEAAWASNWVRTVEPAWEAINDAVYNDSETESATEEETALDSGLELAIDAVKDMIESYSIRSYLEDQDGAKYYQIAECIVLLSIDNTLCDKIRLISEEYLSLYDITPQPVRMPKRNPWITQFLELYTVDGVYTDKEELYRRSMY